MKTSNSFCADFIRLSTLHKNRIAIIDSRNDISFTYGKLAQLVSGAAAQFQKWLGETRGVVYSALPNSAEQLVALIACMRHGLSYAPIAMDAPPGEGQRLAACAGPGICLVPDGFSPACVEGLASDSISIRALRLDGCFEWIDSPSQTGECDHPGRLLVTTSGTTSAPKVMLFNTDVLWSSACSFSGHHEFLNEHSRYLNILPMSYLGGLFNLGLIPLSTAGSTVVAEAFSGKTFLNFWQTVERFEVNTLWLVPTIVRGLLGIAERTHRERFFSSGKFIKASFLGTAPISLTAKSRFEETFGFPLIENFALSETTFFTSETLDSRGNRQEASVGEILPFVELEIRPRHDSDQETQAPEAGGEIWVKTPYLFEGYLETGKPPRLTVDERGFFPTGDLGIICGNTLVIQGRTRDIIKRGGMFVSLREIELLAETHPAVAEAAAVSVPHDFYGEDSVVFVRLLPDTSANAQELLAWLHSRLAKSKWPSRVVAVDDFPRTRSGKILTKQLEALL